VTAKRVVLRVLLFHDPHSESWIAQALERDIAAFGADVEEAKRAFERTVSGYFTLLEGNPRGLEVLKPAPDVFWDTWERVASERMQAERMLSIPAYMMPAVTNDPLPA
jgi:hypothetical protein